MAKLFTFEEFKKQEGTQPAKTPESLQKRGLARKVGEFIAPTTTGLITGEKELGLRTGLGAALEIGSFAIPTGVVARGLGLAGKGAIAGARALKVAKQAKKATTLGTRALRVGRKVGREAKIAAGVGGVSGAMFGAGRALGRPEAGVKEIVGEAAITGAVGAFGGAVLAPTISLTSMAARGATKFVSKAIRTTTRRLRPDNKALAIEALTDSFEKSFVADKSAINNKLDQLMVKSRRVGGPDTPRGLLQELAEEGYQPIVNGELANMRPVIDDLIVRRTRISNQLDKFLEPIETKIPLASFKKRVMQKIADDFTIEEKASSQVNKIFKSLTSKHGNSISALQINAVRKEFNKQTKAFAKEKFMEDTADVVARTTREILDEVAPTNIVRSINSELGKLFRLESTSRLFHNKKISAGFLIESSGRFIGTIGGAGLGLAVAGPGGLVVAGILANLGSKAVAQMVRKMRFNPQTIAIIRRGLNQKLQLKRKLLKEATGADKALLVRVFGDSK